MRRSLPGTVAGILLIVPALAVLAGTMSGHVRDDFESGGYSGGSASGGLSWVGQWTEYNDDGSPASDAVRVVADPLCYEGSGKCLRIDASEDFDLGVYRSADLSWMIEGELCFHFESRSGQGTVKVWVFDGVEWTSIKTVSFEGESEVHPIVPLGDHLFMENFQVKIVVDASVPSEVYLDAIEVKGTTSEGGTTTTTTEPTTSTTVKSSSTTSKPTNTTSTHPPETTTTVETTTTTRSRTTTSRADNTTTTTIAGTTTTTDPVAIAVAPTVPPNSGIRDAARGLLASYDSRGFSGASLDTGDIEVLGAEVTADFSIAAEAFGAAQLWIAILALVLGAAILSGMDLRRIRRLDG